MQKNLTKIVSMHLKMLVMQYCLQIYIYFLDKQGKYLKKQEKLPFTAKNSKTQKQPIIILSAVLSKSFKYAINPSIR